MLRIHCAQALILSYLQSRVDKPSKAPPQSESCPVARSSVHVPMHPSEPKLTGNLPVMFRPPVNRAMRVLDRSFFRKTIPLSAATVFKNSDISKARNELAKSRDLLTVPRLNSIQEIKENNDLVRKCLLLREDIKHDGSLEILGFQCLGANE